MSPNQYPMAGTNKKLTTAVENDVAYWRNGPPKVWTYKLSGYQVLKKWLSYREQKVLGRPLNPENPEEVQHFTNTACRIARILAVTG